VVAVSLGLNLRSLDDEEMGGLRLFGELFP